MPWPSLANLIGWTGASTSLLAYGLVTQQIVAPTSQPYLCLNVVACACLAYYTFRKKAYANTLLNSLWLVLTLAALIRFL